MLLKEIFEIISKMNKSEKSFFKRYCKLYSNNLNTRNYLVIYEETYKQVKTGVFDEERLMKVIKRKIDPKHFSNAKQYLHQQLLNSLLTYHKNSDPYLKISNMIQANIILHKKGLFMMGMRILGKAKKEAIATENLPHQLAVIDITSQMINMRDPDFHVDLRKEAQLANKQYDELNEVYIFYNKCVGLFMSEFALHPKDNRIKELYENDLINRVSESSTNKAKAYIFCARSILAMMLGKFEEVIAYEEKVINVHKENQLLEILMVKSHQHILTAAIQRKDEATYLAYKTLFLQLELSKYVWSTAFLKKVELSYCRVFNKREEGLALVAQLKDQYFAKPLEDITPNESLVTIYLICFLCQIGEYQATLDWILFWYDTPYTSLYGKRRLVVKVMELITHIELGNSLLVPSLNNALKRDIQKQFEPEAFEKLLFSFFYKMDGSFTDKEQLQAFYQTTNDNFLAIDLRQHHHFWFQLFDFKQYFQNKL